MPIATKSRSAKPCEMAKEGSVWVGASSLRAGVLVLCDKDENLGKEGLH
jgi:hypothetical protein